MAQIPPFCGLERDLEVILAAINPLGLSLIAHGLGFDSRRVLDLFSSSFLCKKNKEIVFYCIAGKEKIYPRYAAWDATGLICTELKFKKCSLRSNANRFLFDQVRGWH